MVQTISNSPLSDYSKNYFVCICFYGLSNSVLKTKELRMIAKLKSSALVDILKYNTNNEWNIVQKYL